MSKQERRPLPPLDPDDLKGFEGDVIRYRAGPEQVGDHVFVPFFEPPWMLLKRFGGRSDAGLVAVTMLAPAEGEPEEPWLVRGVLRFENGPAVLSRFAVEHLTESVEVTGFVLRKLRIAELRNRAVGLLRIYPDVLAGKKTLGYVPMPGEEKWAQRVSDAPVLKRGRKGYPIEHYTRIARRCVTLAESGRRDVLKALAEEEGRPYQTVRSWTTRCRELGLLAKSGKQGRADFRPGPNLYKKDEED